MERFLIIWYHARDCSFVGIGRCDYEVVLDGRRSTHQNVTAGWASLAGGALLGGGSRVPLKLLFVREQVWCTSV